MLDILCDIPAKEAKKHIYNEEKFYVSKNADFDFLKNLGVDSALMSIPEDIRKNIIDAQYRILQVHYHPDKYDDFRGKSISHLINLSYENFISSIENGTLEEYLDERKKHSTSEIGIISKLEREKQILHNLLRRILRPINVKGEINTRFLRNYAFDNNRDCYFEVKNFSLSQSRVLFKVYYEDLKRFFTVERDDVRYVVGNDGVVKKYVPKLGSGDANYKVKILTIPKSKKNEYYVEVNDGCEYKIIGFINLGAKEKKSKGISLKNVRSEYIKPTDDLSDYLKYFIPAIGVNSELLTKYRLGIVVSCKRKGNITYIFNDNVRIESGTKTIRIQDTEKLKEEQLTDIYAVEKVFVESLYGNNQEAIKELFKKLLSIKIDLLSDDCRSLIKIINSYIRMQSENFLSRENKKLIVQFLERLKKYYDYAVKRERADEYNRIHKIDRGVRPYLQNDNNPLITLGFGVNAAQMPINICAEFVEVRYRILKKYFETIRDNCLQKIESNPQDYRLVRKYQSCLLTLNILNRAYNLLSVNDVQEKHRLINYRAHLLLKSDIIEDIYFKNEIILGNECKALRKKVLNFILPSDDSNHVYNVKSTNISVIPLMSIGRSFTFPLIDKNMTLRINSNGRVAQKTINGKTTRVGCKKLLVGAISKEEIDQHGDIKSFLSSLLINPEDRGVVMIENEKPQKDNKDESKRKKNDKKDEEKKVIVKEEYGKRIYDRFSDKLLGKINPYLNKGDYLVSYVTDAKKGNYYVIEGILN